MCLSAVPSGNSIGGSALKIEFNQLLVVYAIDLNDKLQQLTPPLQAEKYFNAHVLLTNGFMNYNSDGKQHQPIFEERLKQKLEKVLIDQQG